MPYTERLKYLKLPTLVYRRHRGDMIEVYKLMNGIYDRDVSMNLQRNVHSSTRGHSMKLASMGSRHDIRKYSFSVRVVNIWNSLTEDVVSAGSISIFKNRLDKFWEDQDIMYDWRAKIKGAGVRSLNI